MLLLVLCVGLLLVCAPTDASLDDNTVITNNTPSIITPNVSEIRTLNISGFTLQTTSWNTLNPSDISIADKNEKQEISFIKDSKNGSEFVADELIVRYDYRKIQDPKVMSANAADQNAKIGVKLKKDFADNGLPGLQLVKLPKNLSVTEAIIKYKQNPGVLYAEPNYVYHTTALTPNDPFYDLQWGLHNTVIPGADIDAPDAWGISIGSNTIVVAVVDTGVDYNHPDLSLNIWANQGEIRGNGIDDDHNGYIDDINGWNFFDGNNNPMDGNTYFNTFHGTHCAGILGAVGNNSIGIAGVNWNVTIMPLRVTDYKGSLTVTDAVSAINYANANGAHVISNSWSGSDYSQTLKNAIDASPALVTAAAGNDDPQYLN